MDPSEVVKQSNLRIDAYNMSCGMNSTRHVFTTSQFGNGRVVIARTVAYVSMTRCRHLSGLLDPWNTPNT